MRVGGPLSRHHPAEDDLLGLSNEKLGALDEVREVRLEEGEHATRVRWALWPVDGCVSMQLGQERVEQRQALLVPADAGACGAGTSARKRSVARAEQCPDECVELAVLLLRADLVGDASCVLARPLHRGLALTDELLLELLLDLRPRQCAPGAATRAGGAHVVEKSAGPRAEVQARVDERLVVRARVRTAPAVENEAWEAHDALRARAQKNRSLLARWAQIHRGAIDDHRAWEVAGRDLPDMGADDVFERICDVARVEATLDLPDIAGCEMPANRARRRGRREEDLGLCGERKRGGKAGHSAQYAENISVRDSECRKYQRKKRACRAASGIPIARMRLTGGIEIQPFLHRCPRRATTSLTERGVRT